MKPNFEDPLDTPKQLIDKNITLYYIPGGYQLKRSLLTSPIPDYNKLGETMYIPKDWVIDFTLMWKNRTIKEGTHAFFASHLGGVMLAAGRWYRSKYIAKGFYSYSGFLSHKKWYLNEV